VSEYSRFLDSIERLGQEANGNDYFDRYALEREIAGYVSANECVGEETVEVSVAATLRYVQGYVHENGNYGLAEIIGSDT
jgi:hypothetical protein